MTGLHDFIIEMDVEFNETFKTEGGFEFYMNQKISQDKLSNRFGRVVSTPVFHDTEIEPGDEVLFDPTILYKQIYVYGTPDSPDLMDKEKKWYKIHPKGIVLYRKPGSEEWKGHLENSLVEPIMEEEPVVSSVILAPEKKTGFVKGRARALFMNRDIEAEKGDLLVINPNGGLPYWINGKEYWWIRNQDIHGRIHE